jgi:hypothetical protein
MPLEPFAQRSPVFGAYFPYTQCAVRRPLDLHDGLHILLTGRQEGERSRHYRCRTNTIGWERLNRIISALNLTYLGTAEQEVWFCDRCARLTMSGDTRISAAGTG